MSLRSKLLNPLVARIVLFLALFILVSYIIGQKIVASPLLYDFGIFIYGGMGYILLFSIAGFILLYGKEVKSALKFRFNYTALVLSGVLAGGFYILELNINKIIPSLVSIVLIHALFLSIFISLIIGIFGFGFIKSFFIKFKRQVLYFIGFGIITYSLMHLVWSLWPYLSFVVTKAVFYMLGLINSNVSLLDSQTIIFNGFAAKIAEACSGIYSIFLFSALYIFIILIDWNKINKKRAFALFLPAIAGAFLVNIIRVFLLFVIGAYVSREGALGLYHSYTGMIFFLIYFGIFWALSFRMKNRQNKVKLKE
jgi:exosortase/archaeosortase family protein